MLLLQILCPNDFAQSIFDIDLDGLRKLGISGMILDLDNTLMAWDRDEVPAKAVKWVNTAKEKGFSLCIASNATGSRVAHISETLGIPAISKAVKPRKKPFRKALEILKLLSRSRWPSSATRCLPTS